MHNKLDNGHKACLKASVEVTNYGGLRLTEIWGRIYMYIYTRKISKTTAHSRNFTDTTFSAEFVNFSNDFVIESVPLMMNFVTKKQHPHP